MAKQLVKCIYCKDTLDKSEAVQPNPNVYRYAHRYCYEQVQASKTQAEREYEELENYIKELFDINVLNATITKQIKTFKENFDMKYLEILQVLKWWIEVKHEKFEDKNYGIAIVPYIYDQAKEYYRTMWMAEQANNKIDLEHYKPKEEVVYISCEPTENYIQPKLMDPWKEEE